MTNRKAFDCVEMKDRIQAERLRERAEIGEEEQRRRFRKWLLTADTPLARSWRRMWGPRA